MKIRTHFNSKEFPKKWEVNSSPSETIPDQSMSVNEIMRRFAQGLPVEGQRVPVYLDENEIPNLEKLDLAERQELLEYNRENILRMQQELLIPAP